MKKCINLLVIAMVLLVGCEKSTTNPELETPDTAPDGEAVFKTVFFYLGDEAKKITSYEEQVALLTEFQAEDGAFLQQYEASANMYMGKLQAYNPDFIDQLRDAVVSNDFEQIKASLVYGGNLLMAIATIDGLGRIKNEDVAKQFEELSLDAYNYKTNDGVLKVLADLSNVMKSGNFDFEEIQLAENQNFTINFNFNFNFQQNFQQNFQLNLNKNLNFVQVLKFHFQLDQNINFNRVFNFVNTFDFNRNTNFAQVQNLIQSGAVNIITPVTTGAKYDNYAGERMIEDIALAF